MQTPRNCDGDGCHALGVFNRAMDGTPFAFFAYSVADTLVGRAELSNWPRNDTGRLKGGRPRSKDIKKGSQGAVASQLD